MDKITMNEQDMAAYAASIENPKLETILNPEPEVLPLVVQETPVQSPMSMTAAELHEQRQEEIRKEMASKGLGYSLIPVSELPSKGLFYPEGTLIRILSATIGDIMRWASMNEDDMWDVNEKMQNIIESCCTITFGPESLIRARWKDLIDIDRIYILFAIHDFTFQPGTNDVAVKIDEKNDIILKKENVKFMEFPEKLMNFYNPKKRCFSFPVRKKEAFKETGGMMDIYISTIGVTDWLNEYVQNCEQRKDNYNKEFLGYAPYLINNWRNLTSVDKYYQIMEKTDDWSVYEWSLIARVKDVIANSISTPTIRYKDNGGVEREVPLYFRNGFKSLFQSKLDIDL